MSEYIKKGALIMSDCKWIVNYDECALNHCICNGCMDCKNYEPKPEYTAEQIMASLKNKNDYFKGGF